jgi:dihydrofolate synthase/folylpolyglutamate synthase
VDSAHNAASAQALANTLRRFFPDKRIIFILGMLKGKDIEGVGKALCPLAKEIILIKINSFRSLSPQDLYTKIKSFYFKKLIIKEDIKKAINYSRARAHDKDVICITGSVYLAGEALKLMEKDGSRRL